MADNRWDPKARATKQVNTVTIALTWATSDTITVTINTKALVVTIGSLTTTAQVATTLQQAWEGDTLTDTTASVTPSGGKADIAEHGEITATVSGSVVTLTHDTAGRPATITVTESTAGDGTATGAVATAATGPNHADNTDNWSAGTLPTATASEHVWVENSDVSILYGLDNLPQTQDLLSFNVAASFTGDIGLPVTSVGGYTEYLARFLEIDTAELNIGYGDGAGSPRLLFDLRAVQAAVNVESTGNSAEFGLPALIFKGTNASNTLDVHLGDVGVAFFGGEVSTVATTRVAGGSVFFADGCTLTTIENTGGTISVRDNVTTITQSRGTIECFEDMTVTTMNLNGGRCDYLSSGTITTLNGGGQTGAVFDLSRDASARTVTTLNASPNLSINDPHRTLTIGTFSKAADVESIVVT